MSISYQKKVAPLESQCCFPVYSINPQNVPQTSPRIFKYTSSQAKCLLSQSQLETKQRKEGIQAMKKSISSISLKRKSSDGFPTNRASINQSQYIPQQEKRFITHSMDSEILKNYVSHYQSLSRISPGSVHHLQEQEKRPQFFSNKNQTLESLAEKFKKNRDIKNQNCVQSTKKYAQGQNSIESLNQRHHLQKKSAKQVFKNSNFPIYESKSPQSIISNSRAEFKSPPRQIYITKTVQQTASTKLVNQELCTGNPKSQNQIYPLKIQMSQVDSMIIQVNPPKSPSIINQRAFIKKEKTYLGANTNITESRHMESSQVPKSLKRRTNAQKQLANYETMTVNSDYEEDEHERVQKIEQSAIMMNFFNPPSFIKDNLALSVARNPLKFQ